MLDVLRIAEGSIPAASTNSAGRPDQLEGALAVLENAEELARRIDGFAVDVRRLGDFRLGGHGERTSLT